MRSRLGLGSVIVACCALAALPLAITPIFAFDWVNHGWYAAYVTHALTAEWAVPMFVSTPEQIGNPVLVFYGTALYVALSPFVWLFGPDSGMRLAVVAALVVPALAMARFFRALGVDRLTTGCLTICLSSSVYQLTNIYTRGAVTEFFAYQLMLLGAVVLLLVFVGEGSHRVAWRLVLGCASLALGALAHPPTVAMAGLFLGLPAAVLGLGIGLPVVAASIRRQPMAWALVATTLVPVALWLEVTVAHRADLGVTQKASDFIYFPLSIDHWIARFWPFPIDFRVLTDGYNLVSTTFLSAPVNSMALLLAVLALLGLYLRPLARAPRNLMVNSFAAAVSLAIIASLLASLPIVRTEPVAWAIGPFVGVVRALTSSMIGKVLGPIQFAYRIVNIVNLTVILAVLGISLLRSRTSGDHPAWHPPSLASRYLLVAAATVSTVAIGSKVLEVHLEFTMLPRISQQIAPRSDPNRVTGIRGWTTSESIEASLLAMRTLDKIPSTQYGIELWGMPGLYPRYVEGAGYAELTTTLSMVGHSGARADARCARLCALLTNLVSSPWATVTLDGRRVARRQLAIRPGALVTILAGPGEHHIEVQLGSWQTAAISWSILWLVVLFWVSGLVVLINELRTTPPSQPA